MRRHQIKSFAPAAADTTLYYVTHLDVPHGEEPNSRHPRRRVSLLVILGLRRARHRYFERRHAAGSLRTSTRTQIGTVSTRLSFKVNAHTDALKRKRRFNVG